LFYQLIFFPDLIQRSWVRNKWNFNNYRSRNYTLYQLPLLWYKQQCQSIKHQNEQNKNLKNSLITSFFSCPIGKRAPPSLVHSIVAAGLAVALQTNSTSSPALTDVSELVRCRSRNGRSANNNQQTQITIWLKSWRNHLQQLWKL